MNELLELNKQLEQFHRDGFLLVRGMYSDEEVADIRCWTDEVAASPEVPGKDWKYFEKSQDGWLHAFCPASKILCRSTRVFQN